MPNCLTLGTPERVVYVPGKQGERRSVWNRSFVGAAIGLVVDITLFVLAQPPA